MRSEQVIFDELAKLCSSPGYVHAIAYLCFRDNMVRYSDDMKPEDMHSLFSKSRLIRTEIATLIGLLLKNEIDYSLPTSDVMQSYLDRTESLLHEIHQVMAGAFKAHFPSSNANDKGFNPFTIGAVLREPIFYSGESAYAFQYRDLSAMKYSKDDEWLKSIKGFSIQQARDVVSAVSSVQEEKAVTSLNALKGKPPETWTVLPGYIFIAQEIAARASMDVVTVNKVLEAFAVQNGERNSGFTSIDNFNVANASPLIRTADGGYILFQIYSLAQALYEAPFYWMGADRLYVNTAMQHRGLFTEEFAAERLVAVFGKKNVYSNVDIFESKGKKLGEIDVLVLFGNRVIVLQAKSKRLTLEARKGNDGQIREDFKKSIQDSCDQAYVCASLLGNGSYVLKDAYSREVITPVAIKQIYILCVISDHYPALSFQARQFLRFEPTKTISPPFVLDVFALDAMTEMLESPLQLISYVDRRTRYSAKLMASHELTVLSYHLKRNLWLSDEHDMVMLDDDWSIELDISMLVRRDGIPGKRTPDGILTRLKATTLGRMVNEIESRPDPDAIDLGCLLLMLSEETFIKFSRGIDGLIQRAIADGLNHDLTLLLEQGTSGLTIHCNNDPIEIGWSHLENHCRKRKYAEKAERWFGLCVSPRKALVRFCLSLDFKWEHSEEMDALTRNMARPQKLAKALRSIEGGKGSKRS